jgi:hypothetical protein
MNLGKKIVSVAAAAALVAGVGALAATPATAAAKAKVGGTTVITVPLALVGAAGQAGVAIAPISPSGADATTDVVGVTFPVTGPAQDGVIHHRGGLSFASSNTGITLTATKPQIEYATSGGDTASITVEINGVPAQSPFAALNGTRIPIFTVNDFTVKGKWGKATKAGKGWQQTYTSTVSGSVVVVDNATVVDAVNGFMGAQIFTAGMDFGDLASKVTTSHTCKTKKECSQK